MRLVELVVHPDMVGSMQLAIVVFTLTLVVLLIVGSGCKPQREFAVVAVDVVIIETEDEHYAQWVDENFGRRALLASSTS